MPIPDLSNLPGVSRPGVEGNTLFGFNSTTEPQPNNESICEATVEGKMYKLGSSALTTGNIVYKDSAGSELAEQGFYKTVISNIPKYYQIGKNGQVIDIQEC